MSVVAALVVAALVVAVPAGECPARSDPPTIGPPVQVDTNPDPAGANESTAAACDLLPLELIAGWNDYRDSEIVVRAGFSVSMDGGESWSSVLLRPPPGFEAEIEGDPMTAVDPRTGTMWAGAISFAANGGVFVARKDPGSATFGPSVMARAAAGADKGWMAAGPRFDQPDTTRVFVAFNQGIIWSDDMGDTWTSPRSLGPGFGFLPRIGPNGEIYVAYATNGLLIKIARSLDDGDTFTTHTIATRMDTWGIQDGSRFPGTFRVPPLVAMDVDPLTGTLYACYFDTTEYVVGYADVDVYLTRSYDQGETWAVPRDVTGDLDPPGDQFFSWLEVDSRGRIHLVYLDSRHTAQGDFILDGMFDAYYAYSLDEGYTFSEHRLTESSWSSIDDGVIGEDQFLGDYLGMAITRDRVHPIHLDTTGGRAALFTRTVEFPPPRCIADFDESGDIGFADLLRLLSNWGPCAACAEDFDLDGFVGFSELLLLLGSWGPCE